jgi:uncharacterized protein (DUF2225 family)
MSNMTIPAPKTTQDGKFECPVCGRSFRSRDLYESHARLNHTKQTTDWSHVEERMAQINP